MSIDHESLVEKKANLQQSIRVLTQLQRRSLQQLKNDEITLGAILHYLTVGIESILDIGSHILTEDFGASPESYEAVLELLGQKSVVPATVIEHSRGMGKFRNKMIHEYADIDVEKIHAYLQKAPQEFEQFDQAFSEYLKTKPSV